MKFTGSEHQWHRLVIAAQAEVKGILDSLPGPLRDKARHVPVSYEKWPTEKMVSEDGIDPDVLGLFVGRPFPDAESGGHDLPAQVILFLESIWEFAEHDPAEFREEVRITFLHELGHYLGLDEDDLEDRDLD